MWSYLRRFSRMTKEMRPSHRIDILTDAIIYYREKRIGNIGKLLVNIYPYIRRYSIYVSTYLKFTIGNLQIRM